jgi:hypothetical protein
MESRKDSFFAGLVAFLALIIAYKVLKRVISLGATIFLLLVVFLMIYFLGNM